MKLTFLLALALTSSVLFAKQPAALPPPLVTTSGSALIRVAPDLADLYFEVEVRHADLSVARKQQAERAAKVLAALRAAGVVEAELQTSQAQIAADYTEGRHETASVNFFRVTQNITCTLHDVKKVADITAAAVGAGATGVREAVLRSSQLRKHRDEARALAVRAAKEKAVALAAELAVKIGRPYTITEGSGFTYSANRMANGNNIVLVQAGDEAGDGTTAAFAPGTISINAEVTVAFVIE